MVVAFYPADDSPVCTRQLNAYTAGIDRFASAGARGVAVSPQGVPSHRRFAAAHGGFPFRLLADADRSMATGWGVLGPPGFPGATRAGRSRGAGSPGARGLRASVVRVFVLGVDPGLSRCGYAVIEPGRRAGRSRAVAIGVIRTDPGQEHPLRLVELQSELRALLCEFEPAVVAVERIFFQHNVRTVVGVSQASGLILAEAAARGSAVVQYSPNEVKAAVTGDGSADKAAVTTMVQRLLGLAAPPRPADAADAAALALCHLAHDPSGRAGRHPRSVLGAGR